MIPESVASGLKTRRPRSSRSAKLFGSDRIVQKDDCLLLLPVDIRLHSSSDGFIALLPDCERAPYARHLTGRKTKEVSDETVVSSSCCNDQSGEREPGVRAGRGARARSGCRHRDSRWRNVLRREQGFE